MLAIWAASAGLVWPLIEYGVVWSIVRSVWGVVCYNLVCPAPFPGIYWALYHPALPVLNNQPIKWKMMILHQLFNSPTKYLIGIPSRSIQIIYIRWSLFFSHIRISNRLIPTLLCTLYNHTNKTYDYYPEKFSWQHFLASTWYNLILVPTLGHHYARGHNSCMFFIPRQHVRSWVQWGCTVLAKVWR